MNKMPFVVNHTNTNHSGNINSNSLNSVNNVNGTTTNNINNINGKDNKDFSKDNISVNNMSVNKSSIDKIEESEDSDSSSESAIIKSENNKEVKEIKEIKERAEKTTNFKSINIDSSNLFLILNISIFFPFLDIKTEEPNHKHPKIHHIKPMVVKKFSESHNNKALGLYVNRTRIKYRYPKKYDTNTEFLEKLVTFIKNYHSGNTNDHLWQGKFKHTFFVDLIDNEITLIDKSDFTKIAKK